jgi:glycosyltransferase involved in cell wall biosynthesis
MIFLRNLRLALRVLRESGPLVLLHRTKRYVVMRVQGRRRILLPIADADVLAADWTVGSPDRFRPRGAGPYTINWVVPPLGAGSGGHSDIFRVVRYLEAREHTCHLYYYDPHQQRTKVELRRALERHFEPMHAGLNDVADGMTSCDAVIATSWETAYPVFNFRTDAKKFYFVQDFEPSFYPVGTNHILAENTYRFGFHGLTAGEWLARKLSAEFDMECDTFYFGTDTDVYRFENKARRNKVLFYAQPIKPRRGFELGVMAMQLFHEQHPEFAIEFVGWQTRDYQIPFSVHDNGVLPERELNALYNECAAALVLSLTNMSLLPLELLSTGCIPVSNDGANNRLVSDNPYIQYAEPSPHALARKLGDIATRHDLPHYAEEAVNSVQNLGWDRMGHVVEAALTRELRSE